MINVHLYKNRFETILNDKTLPSFECVDTLLLAT